MPPISPGGKQIAMEEREGLRRHRNGHRNGHDLGSSDPSGNSSTRRQHPPTLDSVPTATGLLRYVLTTRSRFGTWKAVSRKSSFQAAPAFDPLGNTAPTASGSCSVRMRRYPGSNAATKSEIWDIESAAERKQVEAPRQVSLNQRKRRADCL